MSFDFAAKFRSGHGYHEFLERFGNDGDQQRWQQVYDRIELSKSQIDRLAKFRREMKVLVMAGAWCGDCVAQCPAMQKFAETNSNILIRFVDSQTDNELANELQLCAAARVPQVIFMAEDDAIIGRYGDRTISRYRSMSDQLEKGTSSDPMNHPLLGAVVEDWLLEFERCQLILQTSPRLRRIHGE